MLPNSETENIVQSDPIHVVLCFDHDILPGVHVTMYSARANTNANIPIHFHLVTDGVSKAEINRIRETLEIAGANCLVSTYSFAPDKKYSQFKWIGGYMSYARLDLPYLIDVEKIIYLDSDLLIRHDLVELYDFPLNGNPLAASCDHPIGHCNDRDLFIDLGFSPDEKNYNCGVMLADLKLWAEVNLSKEFYEFATKYARRLRSADQTVINGVCYSRITRLPWKFNVQLQAEQNPPRDLTLPGIYHFIGRPKPWDPGGRLLNKHYAFFDDTVRKTAYRNSVASLRSWYRAARSAKAYLKVARSFFAR
jgi:lipopolysaccharide biosynthesis glycosyltransferase